MSMIHDFYRQLLDSGQIRMRSAEPAGDRELQDAVSLLIESEQQQREHLPLQPPAIHIPSLTWAAAMLYRAAQLTVFRELSEQDIEASQGQHVPDPVRTASGVYSVDLTFGHLPDLVRIVRAMNPNDPLLPVLISWCRQWPFSSVGVASVGEIDIEPILSDRCLTLMYADRILAAEDAARLDHPVIVETVRGVIGAWTDLSPRLAAAVAET